MSIVIDFFKEISKIPRCSKNVKGIINFIKQRAKKFGYSFKEDSVGNIVVQIKSNNNINMHPIILQSHVDMVCEKNESSLHNFETDPIEIVEEDGYLKAVGTTLGADNGIGVAMMLGVMSEANNFPHPDLELLFTVDEEIGLIGALGLDPNLCSGKSLINLDGEEEGYFLVGCAGSRLVEIVFSPQYSLVTKKTKVEILFKGLKGGHSGADIHLDLANSLKLMFFALFEIKANLNFEIEGIFGGNSSNAIPNEAKALIFIDDNDYDLLNKELKLFVLKVKSAYSLEDEFDIIVNKREFSSVKVLDENSKNKLLNMGMGFLHGVQKVENYENKLIKTSLNFSSLLRMQDDYIFTFLIRSLLDLDKEYVCNHLQSISDLSGANLRIIYDDPSWQPDKNSNLLKHLQEVYKEMYLEDANVSIIHAGLETGIISSRLGGIESVTLGPWIEWPHTTRERVNISSTIRVYDFLKKSLERFQKF
ncbi:beta-Ala-His dipeptidase [Borreliella burgdorferi]|uniref:beta-Ala-His dipeptidase n=1 Tax=Borreliella burgdorferi TaxID=139 RepID=UPI00017F32A2|nr:beta-Ala-His dipeptidase [Borreliella burgdorferi]ATH10147.1 beta-Ala-His dipeptidase [Borreliella burgdorferi]EEF82755.1 aminoacyl-histidine dipeptidase [Borreliella burgdorferi WI91-23]MCD2417788.1 beta-Ala-His dipeptidase [Borreliella burgdorferi]MCD2420227.1 beta-Ala-His dipeptidase [Borreliella burgdorferi]PRQ92511.1 beta-Ala-His dipeptidase [Borreliella burgdorferi]